MRDPGAESQYCFMAREANPFTPPKFTIMASSSSAVWGMFAPPEMDLLTKVSTALDSIFASSAFRLLAARHFRQIDWKEVVHPGTQTKCFLSAGSTRSHWAHCLIGRMSSSSSLMDHLSSWVTVFTIGFCLGCWPPTRA